jgi:hypothetical protein
MNNELSIDELDQVAGGNVISTAVNTAVNAVVATAKLVEGLAAAYLNGVVEYGHHVA